MTDITKCLGTHCLAKHKCYRFTAPECKYIQSIFTEVPLKIIDKNNQECEYFWDNKGRKKAEPAPRKQLQLPLGQGNNS